MNPRKFLQSFPALLASALLLLTLGDGVSRATEITIGSVLGMAKDEAEKATTEAARVGLRADVARFIRRTGQEAAFGDYVVEALAAQERAYTKQEPRDDIDRHNLRVDKEAKHALLTGDVEGAKRLLAECQMKMPPPACRPGEWPFSYDAFVDLKFIHWEVEAGRHDAALERLKKAGWPAEEVQLVLLAIGPDLAAGTPQRMQEIMQLIRSSGVVVNACVPETSSILLYNRTKPGRPTDKAGLRKLACQGQAQAAIDQAFAKKDPFARVPMLGIIAEGLAGIPGFPTE